MVPAASAVRVAGALGCTRALLGFAREDLVDRPSELRRREGLQQDVVEPEARRLVDDVGGAVSGHQHARYARADPASLIEDLEAVYAGHLVVDHQEVERFLAAEVERRLAPVRGPDRVSQRL